MGRDPNQREFNGKRSGPTMSMHAEFAGLKGVLAEFPKKLDKTGKKLFLKTARSCRDKARIAYRQMWKARARGETVKSIKAARTKKGAAVFARYVALWLELGTVERTQKSGRHTGRIEGRGLILTIAGHEMLSLLKDIQNEVKST